MASGLYRPLKPSHGKRYILVRVKVFSGLTMAIANNTATRGQTIAALRHWLSILSMPECIQSDNGSHFTATLVQNWAQGEGVKWIFHSPYYPQGNGIVERTNSLIKKHASVSKCYWDTWLAHAVFTISNHWGSYGSPKIKALCPAEPTADAKHVPDRPMESTPPSLLQMQVGQPVLV